MSIRILSEQSHVFVVDIQERLATHLHESENILKRSTQVLTAAQLFNVPISVAEQYPQGLGKSVATIQSFIAEPVYEKLTFSCFGSPTLREHVDKLAISGHTTLIIVGCEAHVYVLQSVSDALNKAYRVVVVDDAVSSRSQRDIDIVRNRLSKAGAEYVSTEMLLFEWTQGQHAEQFTAISSLIK